MTRRKETEQEEIASRAFADSRALGVEETDG